MQGDVLIHNHQDAGNDCTFSTKYPLPLKHVESHGKVQSCSPWSSFQCSVAASHSSASRPFTVNAYTAENGEKLAEYQLAGYQVCVEEGESGVHAQMKQDDFKSCEGGSGGVLCRRGVCVCVCVIMCCIGLAYKCGLASDETACKASIGLS
eukprot:954897-Pelagomonas_calceolata.AAC.8